MRGLKQVHAKLIKTAHIRDPLAAAQVLLFCALSDPPHGDLHYACLVYHHVEPPNCFSWNTIIRALSETNDNDEPFEALVLFRLMLCNELVQPNRFTFPSVLKACARMRRLQEGKQIHDMMYGLETVEFIPSNLVRMYVICGVMNDAYALFNMGVRVDNLNKVKLKKMGHVDNVVLWNVMVDGFVRMRDFKNARKIFDEMPERSVVSWNSMIGYAQNGFFKEAIDLFRDMQIGGLWPNYVTLVSVLPAISRLGPPELGKWVHFYAVTNEIDIDGVLGSALVDMYSKCGSIEKAIQVFESLLQKNVITWNAIIGGLAMHGQARDAIDCFWRTEQAGMAPSNVTYIGVLSAYSHAGLVQEGRSIFNHMVRVVGLEPRIEHYGCMVDLLGRGRLLEEAEELVLKMPIQADDVILKALLGACKMHGNIEMGNRIENLLMKMAPRDGGSYVALSMPLQETGKQLLR